MDNPELRGLKEEIQSSVYSPEFVAAKVTKHVGGDVRSVLWLVLYYNAEFCAALKACRPQDWMLVIDESYPEDAPRNPHRDVCVCRDLTDFKGTGLGISQSFHRFYVMVYGDNRPLDREKEQVFEAACGSIKHEASTTKVTLAHLGKLWTENVIANIPAMSSQRCLGEVQYNNPEGKVAVIVGAGPSLNDALTDIKANRDKIVVCAISQTVKGLLAAGIDPDMTFIADSAGLEYHFDGVQSKGRIFIGDKVAKSVADVASKAFADVVWYALPSCNLANKLWSLRNEEAANRSTAGGYTVTLIALNALILMGFKKIYLAGTDLCMMDGEMYSTAGVDHGFRPKEDKEGVVEFEGAELKQRLANDEDSRNRLKGVGTRQLAPVKCNDGQTRNTTPDMLAMVMGFTRDLVMWKKEHGCSFYNLSKRGAYLGEGVTVCDTFEHFSDGPLVDNGSHSAVSHEEFFDYVLFTHRELARLASAVRTTYKKLSKNVPGPKLLRRIRREEVRLSEFIQANNPHAVVLVTCFRKWTPPNEKALKFKSGRTAEEKSWAMSKAVSQINHEVVQGIVDATNWVIAEVRKVSYAS